MTIFRKTPFFICLLLIFSCSPDNANTATNNKPATHPQQDNKDIPQDKKGNIHAIVSYQGQSSDLPATAVVYVFARKPGTKMPLAVERFSPSQLPMEVAFAHPDNGVESVEIVARLSMTGVVQKLPEDEEIVSVALNFSSSTQALSLEIPLTNTIEPWVADSTVSIAVRVKLSPDLSFPDSTPVFVSARETSGFPVAVQKLTVADLPKTIQLSDADSMFKVNTLSQHKVVTLVARVSLTGKPVASVGDWETVTKPLSISTINQPVELVIETLIK